MKNIHWLAVLVGYLLGSFFGISTVLGMFSGTKKAVPAQ